MYKYAHIYAYKHCQMGIPTATAVWKTRVQFSCTHTGMVLSYFCVYARVCIEIPVFVWKWKRNENGEEKQLVLWLVIRKLEVSLQIAIVMHNIWFHQWLIAHTAPCSEGVSLWRQFWSACNYCFQVAIAQIVSTCLCVPACLCMHISINMCLLFMPAPLSFWETCSSSFFYIYL